MAFGAVAYVRFENADGLVHCNFLVAKSRLAHVKPMTIPRLELSAAVLVVKIDRVLREELEFVIDKSISGQILLLCCNILGLWTRGFIPSSPIDLQSYMMVLSLSSGGMCRLPITQQI